MILKEEEETKLVEILSVETDKMAELYDRLFSCARQLMQIHAPKSVARQMEAILFQTLFFRTVGLLGCFAVKSGAVTIPDFTGPAAMYVRERP